MHVYTRKLQLGFILGRKIQPAGPFSRALLANLNLNDRKRSKSVLGIPNKANAIIWSEKHLTCY